MLRAGFAKQNLNFFVPFRLYAENAEIKWRCFLLEIGYYVDDLK